MQTELSFSFLLKYFNIVSDSFEWFKNWKHFLSKLSSSSNSKMTYDRIVFILSGHGII
jgi:hypothetical protein